MLAARQPKPLNIQSPLMASAYSLDLAAFSITCSPNINSPKFSQSKALELVYIYIYTLT